LNYISLFSSAGVGCFGFKEEGFECKATVELLEKRLKIQKYNNKCKNPNSYICGDLSKNEIKETLYSIIDEKIDVIIATPPCQGMSVANHKKNEKDKKRNSLVVTSIEIVKKVEPKFFIFENVRAFLNTICDDLDNKEKTIKEAIKDNLAGKYNILYKVINFSEYQANSSRTRTLVIGVRKDLKNITPYSIFPNKSEPQKLKDIILDLPSLKQMGEICENDIFHSYRKFDKKMLEWIKDIKEGQSAFDNKIPTKIPHKVVNGEIVFNKNKNGDKYKRCEWGKVAPCIHTRNDILASQNTIHPTDNRVFSIRELMRMMNIPDNFKWSEKSLEELNNLPFEEKEKFLKKEELNIRQCIGEAVPTIIFSQIAKKIKNLAKPLNLSKIKEIIKNLKTKDDITNFIKKQEFDLANMMRILELANINRVEKSAYFTRDDIVFNVVEKLPDFKNKKTLKILEPSVGIGHFLPYLFRKYENIKKVELDVIDIDENSLYILKQLLEIIKIPSNFKITFINSDFLNYEFNKKYDLIVGNPPYKKVSNTNLFAEFIKKSLNLTNYLSFIVPKSLLNTPEFNYLRELIKENIYSITDFAEKAFDGVKIETINFILSKEKYEEIEIESFITNQIIKQKKEYIFNFPYWLIYRNSEFDKVYNKLELGVFDVFRDRQITKKHLQTKGKYRVLKARNIGNNKIIDIENYDCYIDNIEKFSIKKFLNKKVVLVPNLTYYPRGVFLPKNSICDGSVAILIPKKEIKEKDLEYFSSEEFRNYYKIARNYGTRSLNIDSNSVYFFGILKGDNERKNYRLF